MRWHPANRGVSTVIAGGRFVIGLAALQRSLLLGAMLSLSLLLLPHAKAQSVDTARGESLFKALCSGCHSMDRHRAGPALNDVFGRMAGKANGFKYSKALGDASHVWTREKLVAWLSSPEVLVPGQAMDYRLELSRDREDVVQYLAQVRQRTAGR